MIVCWQMCLLYCVLSNPMVRNKHSGPVLQPLFFKQKFFSKLFFWEKKTKNKKTCQVNLKCICSVDSGQRIYSAALQRGWAGVKNLKSEQRMVLRENVRGGRWSVQLQFPMPLQTVLMWFWVMSPCQHKPHCRICGVCFGTEAWFYWSQEGSHTCQSTCQLLHIYRQGRLYGSLQYLPGELFS